MSGLNIYKRLAAEGVAIKEGRVARVGIDEIWVPSEGRFAHPRFGKSLDPTMLEDVKKKGVIEKVMVWEQIVDKKNQKVPFVLCYGSRRVAHALAAREELRKEGKPTDHVEFVEARIFQGSELEFFLERRREDRDSTKVFHLPSEVSFEFAQIRLAGGTDDHCLQNAPPGYTRGVVQAMERWRSLPKPVQSAFDHGIEIEADGQKERRPVAIGLLPALVENVARDDQLETLRRWVADGIRSHQGATRRANAEAIREQVATEDENEEVVVDQTPFEELGPLADDSGPASENRPKRQRVDVAVQKRSVKKVAKVVAFVREHSSAKTPKAVEYFCRGAEFDAEVPIGLDDLPEAVQAFLNGIRWRQGSNDKNAVPTEVKDALTLAFEKAPKQGSGKRGGGGKKRRSASRKVG